MEVNSISTRILGMHPWPFWLAIGMLLVVAFNIWLAAIAVRNYGEPVTSQPYIDALRHEQLLEAQRARVKSGLSTRLKLQPTAASSGSHLELELLDSNGGLFEDGVVQDVRGTVVHLSGSEAPIKSIWQSVAPGVYRSPHVMVPGLWQVTVWFRFNRKELAVVELFKVPPS